MTMNPELLRLSQTLNEIARELHERKARTEDPGVYAALNNELVEVNHRITVLGGLIFTERSADITAAVSRVEQRKAELVDSIAEIDHLNHVIETVSGFLGLVDTCIDLAKRF